MLEESWWVPRVHTAIYVYIDLDCLLVNDIVCSNCKGEM